MSQEKKTYSFKAVGQTLAETLEVEKSTKLTSVTPLGIATPLRLSQKVGSLFEMHTRLDQQIKDNFRNMLSTNHGERLMLGDFGANLRPLAYELGAESSDTAAITRITATTKKYMPFIILETFESLRELSDDGSLSRVGVKVTYSVPTIGIEATTVEALILSTG